MTSVDDRVREIASSNGFVIDRPRVLAVGGDDYFIARRIRMGWWKQLQDGVYQVGVRPLQWVDRLHSATEAAGRLGVASHRAALLMWGMEGIASAPVEITVPYEARPVPEGTIVHRTRRRVEIVMLDGLRVTSVGRTILDCCGCLPRRTMMTAVDSAVRANLITPGGLVKTAREEAGRGVKGTAFFRSLVGEYLERTSTGSKAELDVLEGITKRRLPTPVIQWEVMTPAGNRYVLDFGWPNSMKAVEIDGWETHSSSTALERDLARQNELLALGIELRRFSGRTVHHKLDAVLDKIAQFLET